MLEESHDPVGALRSEIAAGALSEERATTALALAVEHPQNPFAGTLRGRTYWARIAFGVRRLESDATIQFALLCAERCRPQWDAFQLPDARGLPALQRAREWFETRTPTARELDLAAADADEYAAEMEAVASPDAKTTFAAAAARAWANLVTGARVAITEPPHDDAAFVAEYCVNAASSYGREAVWQSRLLSAILVFHEPESR